MSTHVRSTIYQFTHFPKERNRHWQLVYVQPLTTKMNLCTCINTVSPVSLRILYMVHVVEIYDKRRQLASLQSFRNYFTIISDNYMYHMPWTSKIRVVHIYLGKGSYNFCSYQSPFW